jgi:hypothetical protein
MEKRNCSKNWGATIPALAGPASGFKKCCMLSGEFDGSDRHDFFPGLMPVHFNQ